jgi:hypothetical protein
MLVFKYYIPFTFPAFYFYGNPNGNVYCVLGTREPSLVEVNYFFMEVLSLDRSIRGGLPNAQQGYGILSCIKPENSADRLHREESDPEAPQSKGIRCKHHVLNNGR